MHLEVRETIKSTKQLVLEILRVHMAEHEVLQCVTQRFQILPAEAAIVDAQRR